MKIGTMCSLPMRDYCHEAKGFLTDHSIPFTDYDVLSDEAKKNEKVEKSGQMSVPVIYLDEVMALGFYRSRLEQRLLIK